MVHLAAILIPLLLVAFWLWMFNDMLNNGHIPSSEPPGLHWPPQAKNHWVIFFIVLNVFAAGFYYFTEYNKNGKAR